ncbi:hypothetical protein [Dactylosporangium sp. CA-233914]|uniref:hypothetical protein n=1 Tax=Dactylosporangium sp. CA-233914 TaxID=3239934 RepID=UPI003D8CCDE1
MNDTFRLGVVRGISYGLFGPPGEFVPQARALGAGLVRAYLYWSQIEPEPGRLDWTATDALLAQLEAEPGVEAWVTVCSSSPWATRQATTFLPPSPAKDPAAYERFAEALVRRLRGRIRYLQCDNEPSNAGLLWAGSADEYVTQLRALHRAAQAFDPDLLVVLGGCGYDVLSSPPDSEARAFFDRVLDTGRDAFDVFDVHLYGPPGNVPDYVAQAREMMRRHGYDRPVVAGEQAGPVLFEFPELDPVLTEAFQSMPADATDLVELAGQDTPERRAMASLYRRIDELPPRLQMLMEGCPGELSAKRDRIAGRQLVVRTVLALAAGVDRIAYWNLAPEVAGYHDRYQMMDLLFGRLPLLDFAATGALTRRNAAAGTFALLAGELAGATAVQRRGAGYRVERPERGPLWIVWADGDTFDGEDDAPVPVTLPWDSAAASAIDAFGAPVPVRCDGGSLTVAATVTPVFIS